MKRCLGTPFRERNPVTIGALSLTAILLLIVVAFKAESLPLLGGKTYYASFADSSGLKQNDEVRIAGVRVGKVEAVELFGDHVRVAFTVDTSSKFGAATGAQIKIKTLMGAMFLALEPAGPGQLKEGATIPLERTHSAYEVVEALSGLAERAEQIDVGQLTASLDALAEATADTPQELKGALAGLSALSADLAARDGQVNRLLGNLRTVSGVLADRNQDLVELMADGDVLLRALIARRDAVHTLLVSTSRLSSELTMLVRKSRGDLKPALTNLAGVVDVLRKNQINLDNSLRLLAPYFRVVADALGNGPWIDLWIANVPPVPAMSR